MDNNLNTKWKFICVCQFISLILHRISGREEEKGITKGAFEDAYFGKSNQKRTAIHLGFFPLSEIFCKDNKNILQLQIFSGIN